jgi:hypothetical protein
VELGQLLEMLENERQANAEFREFVRGKLADIEQWAAVHDARESERRELVEKRNRAASWLVGTTIALLSLFIPTLLSLRH